MLINIPLKTSLRGTHNYSHVRQQETEICWCTKNVSPKLAMTELIELMFYNDPDQETTIIVDQTNHDQDLIHDSTVFKQRPLTAHGYWTLAT